MPRNAVDLNRLRSKLEQQDRVGVDRNGQLQTRDPRNDGTRQSQGQGTTLKPQRFYF